MHPNHFQNPDVIQAPSALLIRKLSARYLVVLAAVAALIVLDQAIIQPSLIQFNSFAPAINLAGRQRMLSQRLTKAALVLQVSQDEAVRAQRRKELASTLKQWSAGHSTLKDLNIAGPFARDFSSSWSELEPHYQAMCEAAERLLAATEDPAATSPTRAAERLVAQEPLYLPGMERVVSLLEQSSGYRISQLRLQALGISAAVIGLLLVLGGVVVWPATRTIRTQVDGLENRVAERTADLLAANAALEREIVERQQAELEKQRLLGELAHMSRLTSLGHLAAGLAHEINQPLAAIANYSDACELLLRQDSQANPRVVEYCRQLNEAAVRAGRIVRRIRNFARPIGNAASETRLNPLVREVAELFRHELQLNGVCLRLHLRGDELVLADGIQVQQVLVNLIQNAIQALRATSSAERRIAITTMTLPEFVRVEVDDNGPGFGARDPASIFAPFFTTKADGLGIGLSLCQSIVERHGGKIWAESLPGRGARLCFTLPRCIQHDDVRRESADRVCSR